MGPDRDHDSRSSRPRQSITEAIRGVQQFLTGPPPVREETTRRGRGIRKTLLGRVGAMLEGRGVNRSTWASCSGGDASDRYCQSILRGVGVALRLSSIAFPVRARPFTAPNSFRIHQGRALPPLQQFLLRRVARLPACSPRGRGRSLGPSSRPKTPSALGRSAAHTPCPTKST